jgi:hypothetical protein
MKRTRKFLAAFAVLTAMTYLASVHASAAVTMTSWSAGTGFVGKGDIQSAYGWNNRTLQQRAEGLGFFTTEVNEYTAMCGPAWYRVSVERTALVLSRVEYESRTQKGGQGAVTGFRLTGEGSGLGGTAFPGCLVGTPTNITLVETRYRLYSYQQSEFSGVIGTLVGLLSTRFLASETVTPVVP